MSQVTIAIVTHNTKRFWARQRVALAQQSIQDFQILVVDNASGARERLSDADLPANATLIQSETNLGFAAGNNLAFARAQSPYFVALNPDAFPEPDWLERLIGAAERNKHAGAIGSLQVLDDAPDRLDGAGDCYWLGGFAYRSLHGKRRSALPAECETFSACAAAALYRRDAFEEAGGFDESFFCYSEDVDLGFRMRLLGWRIVQANDAIVRHVGGGASGARSAFALRLGARNRIWTLLKNHPRPLLYASLPLHALMTLAALFAHAARGELAPVISGIREAIRRRNEAFNARRIVQARRKIPLTKVIAAMAWSPHVLLTRAAIGRILRK